MGSCVDRGASAAINKDESLWPIVVTAEFRFSIKKANSCTSSDRQEVAMDSTS